jgi:hypothetical protein
MTVAPEPEKPRRIRRSQTTGPPLPRHHNALIDRVGVRLIADSAPQGEEVGVVTAILLFSTGRLS